MKSIIITLLLIFFLSVPVNAEICVLEEADLHRTQIQRVCIDNYEYVFLFSNVVGSIDIQQSFKKPSHAYGGANPKRCKCPEPIIPKKHFWERD